MNLILVYISVQFLINFKKSSYLIFYSRIEPMTGFEPVTSSLPRKRSTPELHRRKVLNRDSNESRSLPSQEWHHCLRAGDGVSLDFARDKLLTRKFGFIVHLERETGFEPATFSLEGWRSTNWATPAFYKWLCHLILLVGRAGFEPAKVKTNRFTVCPRWPLEYLPDSSKTSILKNLRADGGTRTHDLLITNQLL